MDALDRFLTVPAREKNLPLNTPRPASALGPRVTAAGSQGLQKAAEPALAPQHRPPLAGRNAKQEAVLTSAHHLANLGFGRGKGENAPPTHRGAGAESPVAPGAGRAHNLDDMLDSAIQNYGNPSLFRPVSAGSRASHQEPAPFRIVAWEPPVSAAAASAGAGAGESAAASEETAVTPITNSVTIVDFDDQTPASPLLSWTGGALIKRQFPHQQ